MRKSFAILGGGRLGSYLVQELSKSSADIIFIDKNPEVVNRLADYVTNAICGDATDVHVLKDAGVEEVDAVVVAFVELEPAIMAIMAAKELNVSRVIAEAKDDLNGTILSKIGADKVIFPEKEAGVKLANCLIYGDFMNFFEITESVNVVEILPKEEWVGKSLKQLNLRNKHSINVIAIKEQDEIVVKLDPDKPLEANSPLLIIVDDKDLKRIF